jgi:predicted AAA+ superfamily ATPase
MTGQLFENYIICEIYKRELLDSRHKELCYYRTSHGEEIDLIIDRIHSKELIEIKNGQTFKPAMLKQIKSLLEDNDKGFLLYNGNDFPFDSNIKIINYHDYFLYEKILP